MREKTISTRRAFDGRLLKLDVIDVELESGIRSVREVMRHPGAVAVIARLPDGRFVFVRQFRKPIEQETIEVVAGTLEPSEDPDVCARREVKEETGYEVATLRKLCVIASSPGCCDERLHTYYAELKAAPGEVSPDEDEKVDVLCFSSAQVREMICNGEICDSKTLAAWALYIEQIAGAP